MIDKVREIAKEITGKAEYVKLDADNLYKLSEKIKESPQAEWKIPLPGWYIERDVRCGPQPVDWAEQRDMEFIEYELMADAVNYCYWYGKGDIRPLGSNSGKMYQLLDEVFSELYGSGSKCERFYRKLVKNRFPLLEERYRHLIEVDSSNTFCFVDLVCETVLNGSGVDAVIDCLTAHYPGYASDMFLKRAQLFIMQIQRVLNVFSEEDMNKLTVPLDYQIPKMLRHYDCIHYFHGLQDDIRDSKLIPRGSIQEIEIRAVSIMACEDLAKMSGTNAMVVDNFLWQSRKISTDPFHLTITTDY